MRTFWLAALVALLAMPALAREKGEKKGGGKAETVTGQFVSAALEGGQITWKVTAEDGAEKAYTMACEVVVMYSERNGVNRAMGIGAKGKKVPEAKGNRLVATGTFVSATAEGNKVNVAVTVDGAEKTFVLGTKLSVQVRERKGQAVATRIMSAGGGKKKGDDADKPKKDKRKKKGDAPPNI